jgi:predicted CopG family antitoxin
MITTIQIREIVKNQLDKIKQSKRQTYEEVILELIKAAELQKRKQEALLIEGCKAMAEESLRICKVWETTDATLDWDCEGLIPENYLKKEK